MRDFEQRLAGYEVMASAITATARTLPTFAGAVAAAATFNTAAEGSLVYSGLRNVIVDNTTGNNSYLLDLDGDSVIDFGVGFAFSTFVPATFPVTFTVRGLGLANLNGGFVGVDATQAGLAYPLATGATVSSGAGFGNMSIGVFRGNVRLAGSFFASSGSWVASSTAIAGVSFDISGETHYGWIRVHFTGIGSGQTLTIFDWAYEDTAGAGLAAGVVPEPSALATASLGLLALGAAGVRHFRKKKAEVA